MAMTPAEPSRPGRKWPGSSATASMREPFWAAVVVLVFMLGLYVLARSTMTLAQTIASNESDSILDLLLPLAGCVGGAAIAFVLLLVFGAHPRTRSGAASASFTIIKTLMFLAGIILFLGGALQIIKTTELIEQIAVALLALFYTATPLCLHFISR